MAKKWYKGLTATAVAMAVAGVASMVPAFAEDTVAEPEAEGNSLVLAPAAEENKTTEVSTITDAAGNVTTETTTTTTETKEEKDPDFQPTTSETEDTYVDSTGDIIHTETKIETSETTSEVKKESSTEVSGETVQKGDTHGMMSNPSADWDSLKENDTVTFCDTDFTVQSKVTGKDENGNTTYSVVMTYDISSSEKDSPITQDELSEALGQTLTKTGDNTYTYTNAEGKTVTVTISNDESQEYKKVILNVNVVKDVTVEGDAEIGKNEVTNIVNNRRQEISVKEVVGYIGKDGVETTYDETTGRVSKVVKDGTTYTFSYENGNTYSLDIRGWTNEQIYALIDHENYEYKDGEIVDKEGHVLTFDEQQEIIGRTVYVKVESSKEIVTPGNVYGNTEAEAKKAATEAAMKDAVLKLAKESGFDITEDDITIEGDTASITADYGGHKDTKFVFRFSDSSTDTTGSTKWSDEKIIEVEQIVQDDIKSGTDYTVESKIYLNSGTIYWDATQGNVNEKIYLKGGLITPPDGAEEIEKDENGLVTSFTYNGVKYSYVYGTLSEEELETFNKKHSGASQEGTMDVIDNTKLFKITYTIATPVTKEAGGSETYSNDGAQIVTEGDQIYYINGNEKVLLTKEEGKENVYTGSNGKTYTVREKKLKDEDILKLVDPDGSKEATVENGMVTITKVIDEEKTRVTYQYTDNSFDIEIRTETEEKSTVQSEVYSEKDEIKEWISKQLSEAKENGDRLYINDTDVTDMTVEEVMTCVSEAHGYRELTSDEIKTYLDNQKQQAIDDNNATSGSFHHTELNACVTIKTVDGKTTTGMILSDDLKYRGDEDSSVIASGGGRQYALQNEISTDFTSDEYRYRYPTYPQKIQGNSFYSVTGKVAYEEVGKYFTPNEAQQRVNELIEEGYKDAQYVRVVTRNNILYYVFEYTADLSAFGYMTASNNNCQYSNLGYDLVLDTLSMTSDGTVVSKNIETSAYSISFNKVHKNVTTQTVSNNQIVLHDGTYVDVEKETDEEYGGWATVQFSVSGPFDETEGVGSSTYSLYDTRKIETHTGTGHGRDLLGNLTYTYKVDNVNTAYRVDDVHEYDADVKEEWNKTVYNYTTKETVIEAVIGHVDSDSNSGGSSSDTDHETSVDPTPETTPDSETTVDPTPSDVTPSDSTPEPSIPDDVIDDIIAEVEEEVTPIASVPKTGATENTAAAAASAMALGGIAFALSRKRRRK